MKRWPRPRPEAFVLGGYREGSAQKASERKQKAITEAEELRGVLEPMVRASLSYGAMADALAGVGSSAEQGVLSQRHRSVGSWSTWAFRKASGQ